MTSPQTGPVPLHTRPSAPCRLQSLSPSQIHFWCGAIHLVPRVTPALGAVLAHPAGREESWVSRHGTGCALPSSLLTSGAHPLLLLPEEDTVAHESAGSVCPMLGARLYVGGRSRRNSDADRGQYCSTSIQIIFNVKRSVGVDSIYVRV